VIGDAHVSLERNVEPREPCDGRRREAPLEGLLRVAARFNRAEESAFVLPPG
jgi:hypothetical protein